MNARSFEFKAGTRCLDLVDTVAGRTSPQPIDLLSSARELERWFRLAGFSPEPAAPLSSADLEWTRSLREAIYRAARSLNAGSQPNESDIALINSTALRTPARPQFSGGVVTWLATRPVEAALSAIAADAIECFGPAQRERIRTCPECQMLFLDTSRPGKRRWCSSSSGCGNRDKVRRHRQRTSRRENSRQRKGLPS
jgi:predicted RNA-binding Zn ribbon-like protein